MLNFVGDVMKKSSSSIKFRASGPFYTKIMKELSYSPVNMIDAEQSRITGNSDNRSLHFIEDDNIQHSSSMVFASPRIH